MNQHTKQVMVLLLGLILFETALCSPRSEIEALYQRTYRAAEMRYVHGMYAHRSDDFTGTDADGQPHDPEKEAAWIESVLNQALEVEEAGEILSFREIEPGIVECEVKDRLRMVIFGDRQRRTRKAVTMVTYSRDRWRLTRNGWRQMRCDVEEQFLEEEMVR